MAWREVLQPTSTSLGKIRGEIWLVDNERRDRQPKPKNVSDAKLRPANTRLRPIPNPT